MLKLHIITLLALASLPAFAQAPNPIASSQSVFNIVKNNVLKSADKVPDNLWNYKPTPEVRSFGELFAHIADGQYEFCGPARGGKVPAADVEKTAKTRAEVVAKLKEAIAYCDATWATLNASNALEAPAGSRMTRIASMDFNTAHTFEHYGNLVTYMRLNKIVPPSSEPSR
jgi:uncharacterized damage-inducible protein DinB